MKILIVDDDPLTADYLAAKFREAGFAVDTAQDGEDGLFKARNCDYDAIVLDVILPRLDGWEVLKQLRQAKKTPVLMLTARTATPERIRGLDGGADDYVVKPFQPDELLARLRALIRRTANQAHPRIEIGEVVLDLTARTVTRAGQPLALSPREYAIFSHLVLNRGKIVTRTDLYEHLLDENADTLSNLIDVHISKLRKKLPPGLIETRHGHGYRIPE